MDSFVHMASSKEYSGEVSWEDTKMRILELNYQILHDLNHFSQNVQENRIDSAKVNALKEQFIHVSNNSQYNPELLEPIREFLCEAFCLVDILEEITLAKSPEKRKH